MRNLFIIRYVWYRKGPLIDKHPCFFFFSRSVLTVACEQTEVLLFDPVSSRHIKTLVEAHEDCVNNIRYM